MFKSLLGSSRPCQIPFSILELTHDHVLPKFQAQVQVMRFMDIVPLQPHDAKKESIEVNMTI